MRTTKKTSVHSAWWQRVAVIRWDVKRLRNPQDIAEFPSQNVKKNHVIPRLKCKQKQQSLLGHSYANGAARETSAFTLAIMEFNGTSLVVPRRHLNNPTAVSLSCHGNFNIQIKLFLSNCTESLCLSGNNKCIYPWLLLVRGRLWNKWCSFFFFFSYSNFLITTVNRPRCTPTLKRRRSAVCVLVKTLMQGSQGEEKPAFVYPADSYKM